MSQETINCTYCGSNSFVKNGKVNEGNQRYRCKECNKNFTITKRKYSPEFKLEAIKWYLEGVGIRSIERRMGVSARVVLYWIKNFSKAIRQKLSSTKVPDNIKDLQIVEVDELCTWIKKSQKVTEVKEQENGLEKENTSGYGLLLIDDQIVFLILR